MTDSGPDERGEGRPEPEAPAWHSFGVPHGGAPEPPPYTPAMRERARGELTQPIDTSRTQEVPPEPQGDPAGSDTARPWWTTPGSAAAHSAPAAGTDPQGTRPPLPPPIGEPYAASWAPHPSGTPSGPSTPDSGPGYGGPGRPGSPQTTVLPGTPPSTPRRGRSWIPIALIALVAALVGGGIVLGGQALLNRSSRLGSAVPAPGPGSTARPDGSIAKIAADALPSVVTIRIKTSDGNGTGSGFVIDNQGHILTNNHVATAGGSGGSLTVELNNGTSLPASVVGSDASYDLAVLKIDASDIPPLQFGASKDVVVGDGVIAVGAPLGLDATVTSGIVSALNRPVSAGDGSGDQSFINAIQTDAAINPGNSGGPLLDMNGKVIGVNSAIARVPGSSSDSGGNIGVGFAIPSDQASKTAQQLIATGKADHPALGVRVDQGFTGDGAKLASGGVQSGSAAARAGLQDGDVIVEFEGQKVQDANSLIVAVRARNVGDTVTMKVQRGGQTVNVSMTLQSASS